MLAAGRLRRMSNPAHSTSTPIAASRTLPMPVYLSVDMTQPPDAGVTTHVHTSILQYTILT